MSIDTKAVAAQAIVINQLREVLEKRVVARKKMALNYGQSCASMTMCGLAFDVTLLDNHYYAPKLIKGMEVVHAELLKILDAHVDNARSAVEGAEWRLRQLTAQGDSNG